MAFHGLDRHPLRVHGDETAKLVLVVQVPPLILGNLKRHGGDAGYPAHGALLGPAKDQGWDLDDQNELRRFIAMHPEWMTVQAMKRQGSPNIIIK